MTFPIKSSTCRHMRYIRIAWMFGSRVIYWLNSLHAVSYGQSLTTPNPSLRSMTVTHSIWLISSHSDDSLRVSGDQGWQTVMLCTVEILVTAYGGVSRVCVFMRRKMTGLTWGIQVSKTLTDSGLFCRVASRPSSTLYTIYLCIICLSGTWSQCVHVRDSHKDLCVHTMIVIGLLVDSDVVLSSRYGKSGFIYQQDLIIRDSLSTRPYQLRPLINKVW